jgi:hypothetical protein
MKKRRRRFSRTWKCKRKNRRINSRRTRKRRIRRRKRMEGSKKEWMS